MVQTVRIPRDAEKDFTVASAPLSDGRSLQVVRSSDNRTVLLAPLRRTFLSVGAGALTLAALVGIVLAWRVTRPLRAVNDTARRIVATGDLQARVPPPAPRTTSYGTSLRSLSTSSNLRPMKRLIE